MAVIAREVRSGGNRFSQKAGPSVAAKNAVTDRTAPPKSRVSGSAIRSEQSLNPGASFRSRDANNRKPAAPGSRPAYGGKPGNSGAAGGQNKPEAEILFQKYFKSVGPRTYAAQLKRAGNGNHFLVLTESKRDEKTNEPRKTRLYIYSEDFVAYFRMLHETAQFIRQNPVPEDVRKRQERRWSKKPQGERAAIG